MGAPMPKLTTRVPKYSRHKQRNLAFVRLDGKQRLLGPYDSIESRQKYDLLIAIWITNGRKLPADWRRRLDAGCSSKPSRTRESGSKPIESSIPLETTVGEIIAQYIPFAEEYYARNRTFEQAKQVCGCLRQRYERTPAVHFGPKQIYELRNQWVINGWGRKHANDMTTRVVAMFRWAAEKSASLDQRLRVPVSVWHALKTVRGLPKGRPLFSFESAVILDDVGQPIVPADGRISPPVDDSTVERTLKHLAQVPADMVRFQRATGCRPGEVRNVRPTDIDRTSAVWLYRPPQHKTRFVESDAGRVIALGENAQAILMPYLNRERSVYCFSPRDSELNRRRQLGEVRSTPLTCGNKPGSNRVSNPRRQPGEVYTVSAYNKAIKRAVARANAEAAPDTAAAIQPWSANQLRKAYALEIREADGLGLDHSQVVLGHKQRATTEKWYAKNRADEKAIEVARRIG
jgi:integrase